MEAATDLVVDPAKSHLRQRQRRHLQRLLVARAMRVAEQETDVEARGKLRGAAHAALDRVEDFRVVPHRPVQHVQAGGVGGPVGSEAFPHRA